MKPNRFSTIVFVAAVILFGGRSVFVQAQTPVADKNYEAVLYIVVGNDDAGKRGEVPRSIANVVRQIREDNSFANYDLLSICVGRLGKGGKIEAKGFSAYPKQAGNDLAIARSTEWNLQSIRDDSFGTFGVRSFRFGLRAPILVETGPKQITVTGYEDVGLSLELFGVPLNTPTLVGRIPLSQSASDTLFLILSVRSAQ